MRKGTFLLVLSFILFIHACVVDEKIVPVVIENEIDLKWPSYFPDPVYNFSGNPRTSEGFYLGKKLFYDPVLSVNNTISCGSCHQQFVAFANADHKVSHGVFDLLGKRNSPALFNLMWQKEFFWDGGSKHIELQPIGPITNPVEMNETLEHVIEKLKKNEVYVNLFRKAFGTDTLSGQMVLKALAQFMGSFISSNSKYDDFLNDSVKSPLTTGEYNGLRLFKQKCSTCHPSPLFTDFSYRNNGLDDNFQDSGRFVITKINNDIGKFKVPPLRNIELTAPYMHDGRFETLEQVLSHYSSGVKQANSLDPQLLNGIYLTPSEKSDIIAFLKSLTDRKFTSDKRFNESK